jgi:hypothetical protein
MQEAATNESLKLPHWLFQPQSKGSSIETIVWWESRRIPYNLIVGSFALVCFILFALAIDCSGHLKPGEDAFEPLMLFVGLILMNVCYTGGWIVEVIGRMIGIIRSQYFSPILLKFGLGFSLFVVSLPAIIWVVVCLFQAIHYMSAGTHR